MRGLLVVTVLLVVVLIALPPGQGEGVRVYDNPQADDPGVLATVVMLFTSLRDALYTIGEMATNIPAKLWTALPERVKPVLGLAVIFVNGLALLGLAALRGARGLLRRFLG